VPARRVKANVVESVFPLLSRNYKVSATVDVTPVVATPLRAILDTGAGTNLIREEALKEDWERYRIADAPAFKIVGAGERRLNQKVFVTLFVQLGNFRTKARFFSLLDWPLTVLCAASSSIVM
jgi:hypothetical protein